MVLSPVRRFRLLAKLLAVLFAVVAIGTATAWAAPAPTTTYVQATVNGQAVVAVSAGARITLRATVISLAIPVTSGQVHFCDAAPPYCTDIHLLGTSQMTSAGSATLKFIPGVGRHQYYAVFLPTTGYAGSTSAAASLVVSSGKPVATSTLSQSGGPGDYILTAALNAGATITPTGTVSFLDTDNSNYVLGTASLLPASSGLLNSSSPAVGKLPFAVATGDFNGDGIPDIAALSGNDNSVSILLGDGIGGFSAAPNVAVGLHPSGLTVGDFNSDGKADLAVVNTNSDTVSILLGQGAGTFSAGANLATGQGPAGVTMADFNSDGKADLAIANSTSNTLLVLLGNGDGTFSTGGNVRTGATPIVVQTADFNGDGKADLAVGTVASQTLTILLGQGDGTFVEATGTVQGYTSTGNFAVGDFNHDGVVDLAFCAGPNTISVLLGKGDGTFTQVTSLSPGTAVESITQGDFNGDGKLDLAVSVGTLQGSNFATLYFGNGDGTFTAGPSAPTGVQPLFSAAADLNGDGTTDLVTSNAYSDNLTVLLPAVGATATLRGVSPVGTGTHRVVAYYSGDSTYSPITSSATGLTAVPVNTAVQLTANPSTSQYGQQVALNVTVTPSLAQNHGASGAVTFYRGNSILGTANVRSGIATLNIASLPAGNNTLTAAYAGDANFTSSSTAPVSYRVAAPAAATTTLTITSNGVPVPSVTVGSVVALTATVLSGAVPVSPGTVNFCEATAAHCSDIHLLGTAQLTPAGTATLKFIPAIGTHAFKAVFAGTSSAAGSTSNTASLTVTGAYPSTTTLTANGVPGNYTLTAKVSGSGHIAPTGTVQFRDRDNAFYPLGTAPLSSVATGFSFYNSSTPANGQTPESTAVGDFNGDGKPDMAVANRDSNTLTILLGNGDGTFTHGRDVPTGDGPIDVVAADFNNDGLLDLTVTNEFSDTMSVFLGNGDGTFRLASSPGTGHGPFAVDVGDFNGDGNLDMAVANLDQMGLSQQHDKVTILLGRGDGTFTAAPDVLTGPYPTAVVVGDFNGDGLADLAVANSGGSALTVALGNGDGTFTAAPSPATGANPFWLVKADFNSDGNQDLAVSDLTTGVVTILIGKGDGTFSQTGMNLATAGPPNFAMAVGDLNGDGKADLAVTNSNADSLLVFLGNGDGTFTPTTSPATGANPDFVIAADLDGDGNMDLAVANFDGNSTTVLLSQSSATAEVTGISPVGTGTHLVDAAYGGDSHFSGSVSDPVPLEAQRVLTTLALSAAPASGSIYGQTVTLLSTLSPTAAQNHNISGTVSFYNGSAVIGTGIVTNGAATLTTGALPVGTDVLTASYGGDTNFMPSDGQSISYAVADNPPTIVFNVPDHTFLDPPFTVAATSNSTGAITYSVVSGPATISGQTVTLTGAGTVTLRASQAATAAYTAGSKDATFNVAKAQQAITFASPASPVPLGTLPVTLAASASSGLPVSFRVVSGPATVSGNVLTFTGAGAIAVAADQGGNENYEAALEVRRYILVTPLVPGITLTASPNPVFLKNLITLTAKLTFSTGSPTGTVLFLEGSSALGSAAVSNGIATLSLSTLPMGTHTITAQYSGDSSFTPAASSPVSPLVEDFSLQITNPVLTIQHGGAAVYTMGLGVLGGTAMAGNIDFSITGAPDRSDISFNPVKIASGSGATDVILTIRTPNYPVGPWNVSTAALGLLGVGALLLPFGARKRTFRRQLQRLASLLLIAGASLAVSTLNGCGWGWGPQSYNIQVTATSGQLAHSVTAKLTSRP